MLTAVRESGKPFGFVLNQVQARSPRPSGAAGSLAKRAVELKMAHVLALPAIVLRNGQQDAVGIGLGVTEYAPRGKSGGDTWALAMDLHAARRAAGSRSASPNIRAYAHRGDAGGRDGGLARPGLGVRSKRTSQGSMYFPSFDILQTFSAGGRGASTKIRAELG